MLFGAFILIASFAAPAAAAGKDPGEVIHRLLALSGIDAMVESLQASVEQHIETQVGQLEGEDGIFFAKTFKAAFAPAPIRATIVASFRENYDGAKAESALEWYESELGSKVTAEEARSRSPAVQSEMIAFVQGLQKKPPDPERLELARRMDAGSYSSVLSASLMTELMRGMVSGIAAVAPTEETPPTAEALDEMIVKQMAQLGPIIQSQTLVTLLFSSRNLSTDEIRAYLAFVESEAGQWFYVQIGAGFVRGVARAAKSVGELLVAWVQSKKFSETVGSEKLRMTAMAAGQTFGRSTTQSGCTDAAFQRRDACGDFICFVQARIFFEACLDTSQEEASFCAGVPKIDDLAASIYWRLERCEGRGTTTSACTQLLGAVQDHCASPRTRL